MITYNEEAEMMEKYTKQSHNTSSVNNAEELASDFRATDDRGQSAYSSHSP
jgi:hypothetical protein